MVDNRAAPPASSAPPLWRAPEPDGHTLVLGTNQTHATNQSLLKNCPYDAVKDFAPVAGIADIPHALVVRRGLEADNVAALIELAKKTAGRAYLRFDRQWLGLASRG